ncbi:MAG: tetratricopeptide repeat protein [Polyangiaceae bacterium]
MVDEAEALCMAGEYASGLLLAAAAVPGLEADPKDTRALEARACRLVALGHQSLGHLARATVWADRAIGLGEGLGDDRPQDLGASLHIRAIVHLERGQLREASGLLERAAALLEKAGEDHRTELFAVLLTMAEVSLATGDFDAASEVFHRVLEEAGNLEPSSEEHAAALNAIVAKALLGIGGVHVERGEVAAAKDVLSRSVEFFDAAYGHNHPEMVEALTQIAALHRLVGDEAAAEAIEEELELAERLLLEAHLSLVPSTGEPTSSKG